jgi:hypothetical protein
MLGEHEALALPERIRSRSRRTVASLIGDHPVDMAIADRALAPDFIDGEVQRIRLMTDPRDWQRVDYELAVAARAAARHSSAGTGAAFPIDLRLCFIHDPGV